MKRVGQMLSGCRFLPQEFLGWTMASPSRSPRPPLLSHLPGPHNNLELPPTLKTSLSLRPAWTFVPPGHCLCLTTLIGISGLGEFCQMFSSQVLLREETCWETKGTSNLVGGQSSFRTWRRQPLANGRGLNAVAFNGRGLNGRGLNALHLNEIVTWSLWKLHKLVPDPNDPHFVISLGPMWPWNQILHHETNFHKMWAQEPGMVQYLFDKHILGDGDIDSWAPGWLPWFTFNLSISYTKTSTKFLWIFPLFFP